MENHNISCDLSSLQTDKLRKAEYAKLGIYVPPVKVVLPDGKSAYYIPLRSLLGNIPKHPEVHHWFSAKPKREAGGKLRDFHDGARIRSHPVVASSENSVLNMIWDDIEIANSLGMKRGNRGKLTGFYMI